MPKSLDDDTEIAMQNLKQKLNQCTKRYIEENQNAETNNLTKEQSDGLKSLKRKRKDGEVVIYETDKSKRFSCDTQENTNSWQQPTLGTTKLLHRTLAMRK